MAKEKGKEKAKAKVEAEVKPKGKTKVKGKGDAKGTVQGTVPGTPPAMGGGFAPMGGGSAPMGGGSALIAADEGEAIRILHFSDVLCVWAYVAQVRMEELKGNFGDRVAIEYYFTSIFGDAHRKLEARWRDRGGIAAYGQHVQGVAARFPHVTVHPELWAIRTPRSSLACHRFLRAVKLLELAQEVELGSFERACWELRRSFFEEAIDVSAQASQWAIAETLDLPRAALGARLESGEACADLARDLELAKEYGITVSPSLVFNEGRQRLNGNVGYRVIEANIRELLHNPPGELSWC
jgi:predicted DsbA family dithiol-disulfide isomerase